MRTHVWAIVGDRISRKGSLWVGVRCLIGALAVALLTLVCHRLHLNALTVSFPYLIVVVLLSITGDFFSSALVSIIAVGCLDYFFVSPVFSLGVDETLNVVALAVFLTTSLVVTRLISTLRKMSEEALSSVNRKLIDAEERERTRVARELHDDICQRLALVAVALEQLIELEQSPSKSVTEITSRIQELLQRVSEIGNDLHVVSHRLHSSTLDYLGLALSAKSLCKDFAKQQKVEIDFKSHNVPSGLPLEISLPLFRVLQEALLNSAKHSGARHFEVELFGTSDTIRLTVSDSGIGFEPKVAMQGSGLGLTSMRERMKLVHGEFSIESQPQGGTKICVSVPLPGQSR